MEGKIERVGGSLESRVKHVADVVESMPPNIRLKFESHLQRHKNALTDAGLKQHQLEIETEQGL